MRKILFFVALASVFFAGILGASERPVFNVISVNGAITPPVAEYILQNIKEAEREKVSGLIILLDTPGGLDASMRDIAKGILNAPLPVVVYVHPAGARAASAGVIITIAAHVAAMTPGTNIGAAHPVALGFGGGGDKTMKQKLENDAAAYVRGIAKKRHRSEEWVERAVRTSESITAEEAQKKGVVDFVAVDLPDLLKKMDGMKVVVGETKHVIKTTDALIQEKKMGARQRILSVISDPNIAYILLLLGLAGLYFEFSHPGIILPGVVGAISLILAFFALQTLPLNYAGILLILLAIALFIAEMKVISHGILTVGGVVSLAIGSLILFDSPDPALRVSLDVMIPFLLVITLFFVGVIVLVVKAQVRKKQTGKEGMIGLKGVVMDDFAREGKVFVHGEYWNATSAKPLKKGAHVRVVGIDGLKLRVEEVSPEQE
ncbi:MAG TPA: nodulation protein NfeD [Syntrophales bacterium]|nr:nodulation protein NfeD [Syntrophales bacterium]HOL59828.1 nodulation protein NfeD [Syntrophales bacterium]HPO35954.1 nodulation protein NfeD [Syntrophales bacterium]